MVRWIPSPYLRKEKGKHGSSPCTDCTGMYSPYTVLTMPHNDSGRWGFAPISNCVLEKLTHIFQVRNLSKNKIKIMQSSPPWISISDG